MFKGTAMVDMMMCMSMMMCGMRTFAAKNICPSLISD